MILYKTSGTYRKSWDGMDGPIIITAWDIVEEYATQMNTKKFCQQLYNENDLVCKKVVSDFLVETGKYKISQRIEEQPEYFKQLDFEILYLPTNQIIKVEVERKIVWDKSGQWQGYSTIDVPYRKKDSKADLYVMVNKYLDTLAITTMNKILESKVETKNTIYTNDEKFFKCKLDIFLFRYKKDYKWGKI